eukprot:TRINITY_DN3843_c0_g1_i5.p1 TRINITY_DN3843_c0_g1~~TRINITY_DN3843_c0_g1_i5.p1  ORF type:complete len:1350 (+),score=286.92 TRINITY_DN3843_c0_g1_i5:295-4344(+)
MLFIVDLLSLILAAACVYPCREGHQENVLTSMLNTMALILNESEDVSKELVSIILKNLGEENRGNSPAAHNLAINVIKQSSRKLESAVYNFIASEMTSNETSQNLELCDIIHDLCQSIPQMSERVILLANEKLMDSDLQVRMKAVNLFGRFFAEPQKYDLEGLQPLFIDFISVFTDTDVSIRLSAIDYAKEHLLSKPSSCVANNIMCALENRLMDDHLNVRKHTVRAICDVGRYTLEAIPSRTIHLVSECLYDKEVSVRTYVMERLLEFYRIYCSKHSAIAKGINDFEWIPSKIFKCSSDKLISLHDVEMGISESLFPADLSVGKRVKHWVVLFSNFGKAEIKAFEEILSWKTRLQHEMQNYLLLRKEWQMGGNALVSGKQILSCFKTLSLSFEDPVKAEEEFERLNEVEDNDVWMHFTYLLDPNASISYRQRRQSHILERFHSEHPLHEFVKRLSAKCAYCLFDKEHVKEMIQEIEVNIGVGREDLVHSGTNSLVIFAEYFPLLFEGLEDVLFEFLKGDNAFVKEGALLILAKIGRSLGEQMGDKVSSVDLLLEAMCLEGSRRQAKLAVQALTTITKDAGLRALSVLYKRLVDMLGTGTHLPAILQSLGCIAQNAMSIFETREGDIINFIYNKLFLLNSNSIDLSKTEWEERSENCLLKIYGIKTLVRSFLPRNDVHMRQGIDILLGVLSKFLVNGTISDDVQSSDIDKAHLRLAAAKGLLRLSGQWDAWISPELFESIIRTAQDPYCEVRKEFTAKVRKYLKEQFLDKKYACAFVLGTTEVSTDEIQEMREYLLEMVNSCYKKLFVQQTLSQADAKSLLSYPEYMLVYLVHGLSHHPMFPSTSGDPCAEPMEPFLRQLQFILDIFFKHRKDSDNISEAEKSESLFIIAAILNKIKQAEDAVDDSKSENAHILCDIGLSLTHDMVQDTFLPVDSADICLPVSLYRICNQNKDVEVKENIKLLTMRFLNKGIATCQKGSNSQDIHEVSADENETHEDGSPRLSACNDADNSERKKRRKHDELVCSTTSEPESIPNNNFSKISEVTQGEIPDTSSTVPREEEQESSVLVCDLLKENSELALTSRCTSKSGKDGKEILPKKFTDYAEGSAQATQKRHQIKHKSAALSECILRSLNKSTRASSSSIFLKQKYISASEKKSKSRKKKIDQEKLTGLRIKVWWPLDKQFYEGVVESYDSTRQKHRILYDDGDIEILRLDKERWELVDHTEVTKMLKLSAVMEPPTMSTKNDLSVQDSKVDECARGLLKSQQPVGDASKQSLRGHRKSTVGSKYKNHGNFKISTKLNDLPGGKREERIAKGSRDDSKEAFPANSSGPDSDEEPLNTWLSRARKTQ